MLAPAKLHGRNQSGSLRTYWLNVMDKWSSRNATGLPPRRDRCGGVVGSIRAAALAPPAGLEGGSPGPRSGGQLSANESPPLRWPPSSSQGGAWLAPLALFNPSTCRPVFQEAGSSTRFRCLLSVHTLLLLVLCPPPPRWCLGCPWVGLAESPGVNGRGGLTNGEEA